MQYLLDIINFSLKYENSWKIRTTSDRYSFACVQNADLSRSVQIIIYSPSLIWMKLSALTKVSDFCGQANFCGKFIKQENPVSRVSRPKNLPEFILTS